MRSWLWDCSLLIWSDWLTPLTERKGPGLALVDQEAWHYPDHRGIIRAVEQTSYTTAAEEKKKVSHTDPSPEMFACGIATNQAQDIEML